MAIYMCSIYRGQNTKKKARGTIEILTEIFI